MRGEVEMEGRLGAIARLGVDDENDKCGVTMYAILPKSTDGCDECVWVSLLLMLRFVFFPITTSPTNN